MLTIILAIIFAVIALAVTYGTIALLLFLVSLLIPAVHFSWNLALILWGIFACFNILFRRNSSSKD